MENDVEDDLNESGAVKDKQGQCCRLPSALPSICDAPVRAVWLIILLQSLAREQILGEDQRPLVVRKGKKLKDDHPKREVPPDAPIIDVSLEMSKLKQLPES